MHQYQYSTKQLKANHEGFPLPRSRPQRCSQRVYRQVEKKKFLYNRSKYFKLTAAAAAREFPSDLFNGMENYRMFVHSIIALENKEGKMDPKTCCG